MMLAVGSLKSVPVKPMPVKGGGLSPVRRNDPVTIGTTCCSAANVRRFEHRREERGLGAV